MESFITSGLGQRFRYAAQSGWSLKLGIDITAKLNVALYIV